MRKILLLLFIIFVFSSCGYLHDPFREEYHNTTTITTPFVEQTVYCKLTKSGKITFNGIPATAPTTIKIHYICAKATVLTLTSSNNGEPISVPVPQSTELSFIIDPSGNTIKNYFSIELNMTHQNDEIFIKKISWDKTNDLPANEIKVGDLPPKAFSQEGATLIYLN